MTLPFTAIADVALKVIDRFVPDPKAKAAAAQALAELDNAQLMKLLDIDAQQAQGQLEVNKAEAAHSSIFVAGWRPFVGWGCGVAFIYHFLLQPFMAFALANTGHAVVLPAFDIDAMFTVLMGILGLGGLRSVEKIKGVGKK